MTREVIVDKKVKLRDLGTKDETVVAVADLPGDLVWVVLVVPPESAGEIKVIG